MDGFGDISKVEHLVEAGHIDSSLSSNPSTLLSAIRLYTFSLDSSQDRKLYKIEEYPGKTIIYECENSIADIVQMLQTGESNEVTLKSTAWALKDNIARWYIALRTFALVGLLSVLLYLGIRIILSSASAQDKAKYKNMLKDWLVAVCILFVLHYIMAFMLEFVDKINDMFSANVLTDSVTDLPSDDIMNKVRTEIGENYDDAHVGLTAGYTLMYLILVILTISFTFQYLKRVVYMAFLTMIAPLIALTYPIDKVKDGKAQAFSFWLKEYIVNCLIQPVHLLLYTLLITNAMDFATENVIYAIVALTFLMPAEKIIKQMFGLNSQQSSYNTLGAAAGGAMVMNMLNKVKGMGSKGGSSKGGNSSSSDNSSSPVRTATRNNGAANGVDGGASGGSGGSGSSGGSGGAGGSDGADGSGGKDQSGGKGVSSDAGSSRASAGGSGTRSKKSINGASVLKSTGKFVGKGLAKGARVGAKGAGAAALTTVMLAADIADGKIDNLGADLFAGISAGSALGNSIANLPGKGANLVEKGAGAIQRKMMGDEAYENKQFDKEFYKSSGYKKIASSSALKQYSSDEIKAKTQMFLDNGITDAGEIKKALEAEVNGDEYAAMSKLGVSSDLKKFVSIRDKNKGLKSDEIAARMAIAKNMPTELYNDKGAFVRYARRYGIQKTDAEELFKDIDNFA